MARRIFIASFQLETNTFAPGFTTEKDYANRTYREHENLIDWVRGNNTSDGGFADVLEEAGAEIVYRFAAVAAPGPRLKKETYDEFSSRIVTLMKEADEEKPLDGFLLALHGAMVTEDLDDGEGTFLKKIREEFPRHIPIGISLDFHVNLSEDMLRYADIVFTSRYYPHTDFMDRGRDAARLLLRMIEGEVHPTSAMIDLPILYPHRSTFEEPLVSLIPEMIRESEDRACYGVFFTAGFCRSDCNCGTSSIYAITENDPEKAKDLVRKYARKAMDRLEEFENIYPDVDDAIRRAMASDKITVLAEASDNTGSGYYGDATVLLQKLLDAKVPHAALAYMVDPETVEQASKAGVGATIRVRLGGKSSRYVGSPVVADAEVISLTDGRVRVKGPMYHATIQNCGPTATIRIDGVKVVVISNRTQPFDEEAFRYNGVEPLEEKIIALKSAVHFRSAYMLLTDRIEMLDLPNFTPMDERKLVFHAIPRPVYPLEDADTVRKAFEEKLKIF